MKLTQFFNNFYLGSNQVFSDCLGPNILDPSLGLGYN